MDPEKHSTPTVETETSPRADTDPAVDKVMNERDAITLHQQLSKLLAAGGQVDENHAKRLRKSWDTLLPALDESSPMRQKLEHGFDSLRGRIHNQVDQRNDDYARIEQQLVELKKHVKADDLQSSQQVEQKIINGLNRIKGLSAQRRQKVIGELEALQPRIKKLASWRQWGTEQAREKIIEEIRHIHENEKSLEKIAKRIQQAREEWKQWDQSGEGGDHKLYPVFDAACTKAYEPCKAHFDAQRKQRQAASRHRTEVCETLEKTYGETDWRNPDWKSLQQLLREQTSRWRKLGPADYRDRKPLGKRFDAIMARFDGPLDRERKRNLKQREELIAQVEKLSAMEDTRKAISEIQVLKKQWKVTVSGKRKQEQDIWNRFTAACDAVYNRGREAKKAFDRQLDEQLESKRNLCSEMEQRVASGADDAAALASDIKRWKSAWEDSGRAPKNQARQIDRRYRDAMAAARTQLADLDRAAQSEIDDHLFRRAAYCAGLERRLLAGESLETDQARADYDALPALPEELQQAMDERFQRIVGAAGDPAALQTLEKSLESAFERINGYLLQLEINAGVDSPAEYGKQRMALQIGRLSSAIGKGADQELLDNPTLVTRIHSVGAISPERQAEIDRRFRTAYDTLQSSEVSPNS